MCVVVCECLRCDRRKRCRDCYWIGASLGRMEKHGEDTTAAVMCRVGDGVQRCPGYIERGRIGNLDNERAITALLPEFRD